MRSLIVSFVAVATLLATNPVWATRQVRVYDTTVASQSDSSVQAQAALRVVLVRATGDRNAANDPAFASVLANAQQYVLSTQPARGGATTVLFDAGALERDITAAGRTIWSSERPVLLVVLTGGPASGAYESRRSIEGALDGAGNRRGQPINIVRPEAVGLPTEGDIAPEAALAAAQRARADAALVGYGDSVPGGGPWRWVLTGVGLNETWTGTLDEGVHGAADVFARNAAVFAASPDLSVLVEIEGVLSLKEYASVAAMLGDAPGVRSVLLAEAAGTRGTFNVVTRGGTEALQAVLAANPRFERLEPKAGGALAFRLRQ